MFLRAHSYSHLWFALILRKADTSEYQGRTSSPERDAGKKRQQPARDDIVRFDLAHHSLSQPQRDRPLASLSADPIFFLVHDSLVLN